MQPRQMLVMRAYGNILHAVGQWGEPRPERLVDLEPAMLDAWMAECEQYGVTTVLWRANCAGTLTYPSRYTALAGEPPLPYPRQHLGATTLDQGWTFRDWEVLGYQCRRCHTLEEAVRAAHRHGLELFLDFSTFDMVGCWSSLPEWPAGGDRAWDPAGWLCSRDQEERLAGIPCYSDEGVRRLRVAEIEEALATEIDGVWLGFFSHVASMAGEERCAFGYEPAILEEYRRRHGVDPLTEPVDPNRLYALHGEAYTAFVRQASQAVRRAGRQLLATSRTDGIHGWGGQVAGGHILGLMGQRDLRSGGGDLPYAAALRLEWERWVAEGLVDGLIFWAPWEEGLELVQAIRERTAVPVHLFRCFLGWDGQVRPPHIMAGYHRELEAVRQGRLDGYCLHSTLTVPLPEARPSWREVFAPEPVGRA